MPPTWFQLPAELLYMVGGFLLPASKGCLALTCRTYHEQFKSVFQESFFDFVGIETEVAERPFHSTKNSEGMNNRLLFLRQARTANWPYCGSCRMLHPRDEFEPDELDKKNEGKHCRWPTMSLSNAAMRTVKPFDRALYYLPSVCPWSYTHYFPEFGFPQIPFLRLEYGHDDEQSIVTARYHNFNHVPVDFHALHPMI